MIGVEHTNLTQWKVKTSRDSKDAEITSGLLAIAKQERDIIKLAEVRARKLLLGSSIQEIDNAIRNLMLDMKTETHKNLELQRLWNQR